LTRFGIIDVTKPYSFIRFGAIDVTKPNEIIGFGAIDVTKACEFIGFGAFYVQFWFEAQLPQPGSWTSRLGKAKLGVIEVPGERQSRRYADLFFVALKGLAGATLANQGCSHEARGLLRDGQRSANHDGKLSFHTNHQTHVF
jgi:hypothetical protein